MSKFSGWFRAIVGYVCLLLRPPVDPTNTGRVGLMFCGHMWIIVIFNSIVLCDKFYVEVINDKIMLTDAVHINDTAGEITRFNHQLANLNLHGK